MYNIVNDDIRITYACGNTRNYTRLERTSTAIINAHEESNRLTLNTIIEQWEAHAYACKGVCYHYDPTTKTHTLAAPTIDYIRQVTK